MCRRYPNHNRFIQDREQGETISLDTKFQKSAQPATFTSMPISYPIGQKSLNAYPRKPIELRLISRGQLSMYRCQGRLFTGEFFVKVARIRAPVLIKAMLRRRKSTEFDTHDCREVRRRNAFMQHVIKIDILEEWVPLDLFSVSLART
jgi:hypothetical protein